MGGTLGPLAHLVPQVRRFDRFPTVDDALRTIRTEAAATPGSSVRRLGVSRAGEPLDLVTLGSGPRDVLVLAGPHPNEPVGLLTACELVRLVGAAIRAGDPAVTPYTWHVLPCWDLDGARLNEAWYTGPTDITSYHRHFYRPGLAAQPEWTFPLDLPGARFDRPLPETVAVMTAIDTLRPEVMCSLHNSDLGGAFYILDRADTRLAPELTGIPAAHGLPVETVSMDTIGWDSPAPGVHILPGSAALHPGAGPGHQPEHGVSSLHYAAQRHGTRGVIAEVPQWHVRRPHAPTRTEAWTTAIRQEAARLLDVLAPVEAALDAADHAAPDSPFVPAVRDTVRLARLSATVWTTRVAPARPTDPVLADALWSAVHDGARLLPLRALGMWQRAFPEPAACSGPDSPDGDGAGVLGRSAEHAHRSLGPLCESFKTETGLAAYPIGTLVAAQLAAVLASATTPMS
ncbi:hypothetical protein [Kitasatospora sp. NPDC094011]|uniref:hypothetical protein n=1 Tax=Kitasatospora sp. NPDC094011 TaxID=3364090 RepID=UPI0038010ACD